MVILVYQTAITFSQLSLNPPQDRMTSHTKVGFSFTNWTVILIERTRFLSLNPLRNKERALHFPEQLTLRTK